MLFKKQFIFKYNSLIKLICLLQIFPKKYDTQASLTEHRLHLFEYVILVCRP